MLPNLSKIFSMSILQINSSTQGLNGLDTDFKNYFIRVQSFSIRVPLKTQKPIFSR